MADHERAMLSYVRLADESQRRQQAMGADKFLVLAGAAACRAGWLSVAERCRQLVLVDNPSHLIGGYRTFPEAMWNPDFQTYLKQLERFVGYERAEHLLRELNVECGPPETATDAGHWCLTQLSAAHWAPVV